MSHLDATKETGKLPPALEQLKAASSDVYRLSKFLYLPNYDGPDFVARALPLANEQATFEERADSFFLVNHGVLLAESTGHDPVDTIDKGPVDTELENVDRVNGFWSDEYELRSDFRRALGQILKGMKGTASALGDFISSASEEMILVASRTWDGSTAEIQLKYCPLSTKAVIGHVLMLLLDKQQSIGKDLRKCKLDSCKKFFISQSSAKGGRKPLFCTGQHRKEYGAQSGTERMRKCRQKKLHERSAK